MNNKNNGMIFAVIVTFLPELHKLQLLLDSLRQQVGGIVIVDNGSSELVFAWIRNYQSTVPLIAVPLFENKGIAFAQNIGIEHAIQKNAEYVIFFDHDSLPAPNMISKLKTVAEIKAAAGIDVASVGPRYLDDRFSNPPPFLQVHGLKVVHQPCLCVDSVVEVDYLIASGCLVPMRALIQIGQMKEDFFIDYVDIEWGLRAKSKGFKSYGACAAIMSHQLGDEPFVIFGKAYPRHSALRHYYHFRNATWMYRQSWLPLHWKLIDGWRLFLKYGFYTLLAKPRHLHWWMMTKGIWHGLSGRMGRLD